MSVKVKRKLWIFAAFIPLRIRYNNKSVGTLYGSQELEFPAEDEGELEVPSANWPGGSTAG